MLFSDHRQHQVWKVCCWSSFFSEDSAVDEMLGQHKSTIWVNFECPFIGRSLERVDDWSLLARLIEKFRLFVLIFKQILYFIVSCRFFGHWNSETDSWSVIILFVSLMSSIVYNILGRVESLEREFISENGLQFSLHISQNRTPSRS